MESKNIQGLIIFLIFIMLCLVIIHYSNNSINFVKEFFEDVNQDNEKISNNKLSIDDESDILDKKKIIFGNHKNIIQENQETFPLEGIDYNNICPHYDGQYYAFDNTCRPCEPGEKLDLINKKCVRCPVDTYTVKRNTLNCVPCISGTTTENKIGQKSCVKKKKHKMKNVNNLIGKEHTIMKNRIQIQKEQDAEIKRLKGQMDEIMNSIDMIKEVDNPLVHHK